MCVEPPDSDVTHVYMTGPKMNVPLHNVRLEESAKSLDRHIVIIDDLSHSNIMDGTLGHAHVRTDLSRNPGIDLASHKPVSLDPAPANVYWNVAFTGSVMPG